MELGGQDVITKDDDTEEEVQAAETHVDLMV